MLVWPTGKGGVTVRNEDVERLREGEFLNDVIINWYLKYLEKVRAHVRMHVDDVITPYRSLTHTHIASSSA